MSPTPQARRIRRTVWTLVGIVALIVLSLGTLYVYVLGIVYQNCKNGNEIRAGIIAFLEQDLANGDGVISPREQQVYDLAHKRFEEKKCPPEPIRFYQR